MVFQFLKDTQNAYPDYDEYIKGMAAAEVNWYGGMLRLYIRPDFEANRKGGDPMRQSSLLGYTAKGQGLLEYALILILVAVIVLVVLALLGPGIGSMFSNIIPKI